MRLAAGKPVSAAAGATGGVGIDWTIPWSSVHVRGSAKRCLTLPMALLRAQQASTIVERGRFPGTALAAACPCLATLRLNMLQAPTEFTAACPPCSWRRATCWPCEAASPLPFPSGRRGLPRPRLLSSLSGLLPSVFARAAYRQQARKLQALLAAVTRAATLVWVRPWTRSAAGSPGAGT